MRLKKLIFRTSRGIAYTQFFDLKEKIYDYYGNQLDMSVFFIYFPQNFSYLRDKLQKVCDSFQVERLEIPTSATEI